jgi:hypothetical protein
MASKKVHVRWSTTKRGWSWGDPFSIFLAPFAVEAGDETPRSASSIFDNSRWYSPQHGRILVDSLMKKTQGFRPFSQPAPQRYDFIRWENGTSISHQSGPVASASWDWEKSGAGRECDLLVSFLSPYRSAVSRFR